MNVSRGVCVSLGSSDLWSVALSLLLTDEVMVTAVLHNFLSHDVPSSPGVCQVTGTADSHL